MWTPGAVQRCPAEKNHGHAEGLEGDSGQRLPDSGSERSRAETFQKLRISPKSLEHWMMAAWIKQPEAIERGEKQ